MDNFNLKNRAVKGLQWNTLATIIGIIAQIVSTVVLANILSPKDFGLMGIVMIVIGLAQSFADLGINAAIIQKKHNNRFHLSTLFWINILFNSFLTVVLFFSSNVIAVIFSEPSVTGLLQVTGLLFFIQGFGSQYSVLLQKELEFKILSVAEVVSTVISLVIAIVAAYMGYGIWSLVLNALLKALIYSGILFYIGFSRWKPLIRFNIRDLSGYISFGFYQMGERFINLFTKRIDQILIGYFLGSTPLGYYNFAFNLVMQPYVKLNPIITKIAFPYFSKMQDDNTQLKNVYNKIISVISLINAPLLIGLAVIAPFFIPYVFGSQWTGSVILVQILAFTALFMSLGNPVGSLVLSKGKADIGFKWNLMLCVITIPVIYIGIKAGGIIGAALSVLFLQLILVPISYKLLIENLIGKCYKEYYTAMFKHILISLVMSLCIFVVSQFFEAIPVKILLSILNGAVIYAILIWEFDRSFILFLKKHIY